MLNAAVYSTGVYEVLFVSLIIIANFATAFLIFRLCQQHRREVAGLIAAYLFLLAIPAASTIINPRQFANTLILLAFITESGWISGSAIGFAAMLTQFSIFAFPSLFLIRIHRQNETIWQWVFKVSTSFILAILATFSIAALLWGIDAALAGARYSLGAAPEYVARQSHSPFGNQLIWIKDMYRKMAELGVILGLGLLGLVRTLTQRESSLMISMGVLAVAMSFQFIIRSGYVYFILVLPPVAILAASQVEFWASERPCE
jgi:MFS family permease